ncbi:MAG: M56 family metallopeptidase, partial [Bacteroidota bacterium]
MNNIITFFENTWTEALGWTLLHSLWIGALVCLLWRLSLLGQRSSNWRYLSSLIALGSLFVLVMGTFAWELSQIETVDGLPLALESELPTQASNQTPTELLNPTSDSWLDGLSAWITPYFPWISLAWISGIILLSLRLLGGWLYLEYLRRSGRHSVPLQWQKQVEALSIAMNIKRRVQLIESNLLDHPITMGFFKPIILFPIGMISQMPPEQIEAILLHELAHIKRADYLINYFQSLVEIILFFHPAVWWISQDLRESREHCCDDLALAQGFDRWQYAQALLQLTKTNISSKTIFAMSLTGNKHSQLSRRIHRLFGRYTPDRFMSRGLLMAILLSASLMTWAFHSAPLSPELESNELLEQVEKEELLFTITPATTVTEAKKFNAILLKHDYELESIVRDEAKMIQSITIVEIPSNGHPITITEFEVITVLLQGEDERVIFTTNGVISVQSEDDLKGDELQIEGELVIGVQQIPIDGSLINQPEKELVVDEQPENELVVTGHPILNGEIIETEQVNVQSATNVKIRNGVISNPKPLYVLNGVMMDDRPEEEVWILIDEFMNAEEIETINVLKGEAAIEKYGSKAEAGVVEFELKKDGEVDALQVANSGQTLTAVNGVLLSPQPQATHTELIGRLSQPKKIRGVELYRGEKAVNLFGPETEAGVHNFLVRDKADEAGIIAELYGKTDHGLFEAAPNPIILLNGKRLEEYSLSPNS